jgi:hypothetical protein
MSDVPLLDEIFANAVATRDAAIAAIPLHFSIPAATYNDICIAISELPNEEQGAWDDFILNAVYEGWTYDIDDS